MLIPTTSRVSPCYPYRYKDEGESDLEYSARLADELEQEILRVGKGKVAAFFAETGKSDLTPRTIHSQLKQPSFAVVGAAAGNLVAVPGYFKAIRRVSPVA
jgi:hypothetical protein